MHTLSQSNDLSHIDINALEVRLVIGVTRQHVLGSFDSRHRWISDTQQPITHVTAGYDGAVRQRTRTSILEYFSQF